jgi:hypothetical protein
VLYDEVIADLRTYYDRTARGCRLRMQASRNASSRTTATRPSRVWLYAILGWSISGQFLWAISLMTISSS